MQLPAYRIRPAELTDAQYVTDLVIACDIADFGAPDFVIDDLLDIWSSIPIETNTWIVQDDHDCIVGYAFLEKAGPDRLDSYGYIHPARRGTGIGTLLLQHIERKAGEIARTEGHDYRLHNVIPTSNPEANALLEANNYEIARYFKRMSVTHQTPPTAPTFLQGITITNFNPEQDAKTLYEAYAEAFADHWDFTPPTNEKWQGSCRQASPEWWILAKEGDEIAGFLLSKLHEDTLYIQQVGVRRAWRGKGIGLQLLRTAFDRAWRAGQPTVSLGVDSQNPSGAYRLYEKAGMSPIYEVTVRMKHIRH